MYWFISVTQVLREVRIVSTSTCFYCSLQFISLCNTYTCSMSHGGDFGLMWGRGTLFCTFLSFWVIVTIHPWGTEPPWPEMAPEFSMRYVGSAVRWMCYIMCSWGGKIPEKDVDVCNFGGSAKEWCKWVCGLVLPIPQQSQMKNWQHRAYQC